MESCDVVVVGAGVMGASAAWRLAERDRSVVLLDRFQPGHHRGSSHGGSRIFRLVYSEAEYVRLALAAMEGWRQLESQTGETLLDTTGGIDFGTPLVIAELARTLGSCGVAHDIMSPNEAALRWPGMRFEGEVLWQAAGGRCRADAAVAALVRRASALGANVRFGTGVARITPTADGVVVRTSGGDEWWTPVVVAAAGAWAKGVLDGVVALPSIEVTREQVVHFPVVQGDETSWPSFIHHRHHWIYGLFTPGQGVKVADHHTGAVVDPDRRSFEADPVGLETVVAHVAEWFPGLVSRPASVETCLYTTTPNEDFVVDRVGPVVVAAGFSGHGFKFAPEIGRLLADLAEGAEPEVARFTLAVHRRSPVPPPDHR